MSFPPPPPPPKKSERSSSAARAPLTFRARSARRADDALAGAAADPEPLWAGGLADGAGVLVHAGELGGGGSPGGGRWLMWILKTRWFFGCLKKKKKNMVPAKSMMLVWMWGSLFSNHGS